VVHRHEKTFHKVAITSFGISAVALALIVGLGTSSIVSAGEPEAKSLLKAMSDYLAAQKTISFEYDANLEIVTKDHQKLALASSGTVGITRPDKVRFTRSGGFANIETIFDGKTLTLLSKDEAVYTQAEIPGTIDNLIDELKDKYSRPLPAADLLMSNAYDQLMPDVVDIKDLGSGVVGGKECDHFAFRKKDVDWQIWIAQGDRPYPCRYDITTTTIAGSPQYSIQIRDWKTGNDVTSDNFSFTAPAGAKKVEPKEIKKYMTDLPGNFVIGEVK
jgi:hypothetical protein